MVSSHGNAHSDTAKLEQIITEFFAKSLRIILESRALYASSRNSYVGNQSDSSPCSSSSSSSSVRPRDKWFNLALREFPVELENINNLETIIIDVILVHRNLDVDPMIPKRVISKSSSMKERYPLCCNGEESGVEAKSERIVERWVVQYENRKIKDSNSGNRKSSNISLQSFYKKSTLLLRSLYTTVRLLPAYKVFRDLNSSAKIRPFTLAHRVSSFVEPFTRKEESQMIKFRFTPVDTSSGRLCLTVMYLPSASDLSSEPLPSLSPQVISDYVGSPLADPLRRFPSFPLEGSQCHGSPSSRQHSWNFGDCKASTTEKVFSPGKDEPQKSSRIRISANNSPRISISRSTIRSYHDDFDDTDFSCPFDVDYDDITDPRSRAESLDHGHMAEALQAGGSFPIRKSNEAAVGALVHMLKKAPPLHHDLDTSILCRGLQLTAIPTLRVDLATKPTEISVQKPKKENLSPGTRYENRNNKIQELNQNKEASMPVSIMSSGIIATRKTTSDALEEFRSYREMKSLLIMRDCNPQI